MTIDLAQYEADLKKFEALMIPVVKAVTTASSSSPCGAPSPATRKVNLKALAQLLIMSNEKIGRYSFEGLQRQVLKRLGRLFLFADIITKYTVGENGVLTIKRTQQKTAITITDLMRILFSIYYSQFELKPWYDFKRWRKFTMGSLEIKLHEPPGSLLQIILSKPCEERSRVILRNTYRVLNITSACFERGTLLDAKQHAEDKAYIILERERQVLDLLSKLPPASSYQPPLTAVFHFRSTIPGERIFGYFDSLDQDMVSEWLKKNNPTKMQRLQICHKIFQAIANLWKMDIYHGDMVMNNFYCQSTQKEADDHAQAPDIIVTGFYAAFLKGLQSSFRVSTSENNWPQDIVQRGVFFDHPNEAGQLMLEKRIASYQLGSLFFNILATIVKNGRLDRRYPYLLSQDDVGYPSAASEFDRGSLVRLGYPVSLVDLVHDMVKEKRVELPELERRWLSGFSDWEKALMASKVNPRVEDVVEDKPDWMPTAQRLVPFLAETDYAPFLRKVVKAEHDSKAVAEQDVKKFAAMFQEYCEEGGFLKIKKTGEVTKLTARMLVNVVHKIVSLKPQQSMEYRQGGILLQADRMMFLCKDPQHVLQISGRQRLATTTADIYDVFLVSAAVHVVMKRVGLNEPTASSLFREIEMLKEIHQEGGLVDRIQDPFIFDFRLHNESRVLQVGFVGIKYTCDLTQYLNDLMDREKELKEFDINQRIKTCEMVISAVFQFWGHNKFHGDIKASNFFFKQVGEFMYLKIADFGLATDQNRALNTFGINPERRSPYDELFIADARRSGDPERIKNAETAQDIFMLGYSLYEILTDGHQPYPKEDVGVNNWTRPVKDAKYLGEELVRLGYSKEWGEFLGSMLMQKPEQRISAENLKKCLWFQV